MSSQGQQSSRQGYQFEPTYRPGETRRKRRRTNSDVEQESVAPDVSDMSNMTWCLCGHCALMNTLVECQCCVSSQRAIHKWREIQSEPTNTCITMHPRFELACLMPEVLQMLFRHECMLRRRFRRASWSNRLYRLLAYRAYVLWIYNNHKLGFGNRVVLPACVVTRIRITFPAEERDEGYTGFHPFEGLWIFQD